MGALTAHLKNKKFHLAILDFMRAIMKKAKMAEIWGWLQIWPLTPRPLLITPARSWMLLWDPVHRLKLLDPCYCCSMPRSGRSSTWITSLVRPLATFGLCWHWTFGLQRPQRGAFFMGPWCKCPTQVSRPWDLCPWRGGPRCPRSKMAGTSKCPMLDWSHYSFSQNYFFAKCFQYQCSNLC